MEKHVSELEYGVTVMLSNVRQTVASNLKALMRESTTLDQKATYKAALKAVENWRVVL